jgi:hypothetical protein
VDAVEFTGFPPPKFPTKTEFWTQLDADSGRSGHLGRDDPGIFHFSDSALRVGRQCLIKLGVLHLQRVKLDALWALQLIGGCSSLFHSKFVVALGQRRLRRVHETLKRLVKGT